MLLATVIVCIVNNYQALWWMFEIKHFQVPWLNLSRKSCNCYLTQSSFNDVRKALVSEPILIYPNFKEHFLFSTHASVQLERFFPRKRKVKIFQSLMFPGHYALPKLNIPLLQENCLSLCGPSKHFQPDFFDRKFNW